MYDSSDIKNYVVYVYKSAVFRGHRWCRIKRQRMVWIVAHVLYMGL